MLLSFVLIFLISIFGIGSFKKKMEWVALPMVMLLLVVTYESEVENDKVLWGLGLLTIMIFFPMLMSTFQPLTGGTLSILVVTLFMVLMLIFMTSSYIVFFSLYELSVIPTLLMILMYGSSKFRFEAGMFFFLFTSLSSLFLLMNMIFLSGFSEVSTIFLQANFYFSGEMGMEIFQFLMVVAFLVKFPVFMFHIWLPKAHVEAPVVGSMVLAGILLKLGGVGIHLFKKFFFFMTLSSTILLSSCLWGGVVVGYLCYQQTDIKILIALSSVNHMSLVICGMMMMTGISIFGGLLIMIGHGFVSSLLFFLSNLNYSKTTQRSFFFFGMISKESMLMFFFWIFSLLVSLGFPPFLNFLGELYIIVSLSEVPPMLLFMALNFLISLLYTLSMLGGMLQKKKNYNMKTTNKMFTLLDFFIVITHLFPILIFLNLFLLF